MQKNRAKARQGETAAQSDRRTVIFGLPAAGAALLTIDRNTARAGNGGPAASVTTGEPAYPETDLVRRYYRLARF